VKIDPFRFETRAREKTDIGAGRQAERPSHLSGGLERRRGVAELGSLAQSSPGGLGWAETGRGATGRAGVRLGELFELGGGTEGEGVGVGKVWLAPRTGGV
jgi:hypothetical protein